MTPEQLKEFRRKVDEGVQFGVNLAIEEHRRMGRSIISWKDGKVIEIPADQIPPWEDYKPEYCELAPKI